MWSIAMLMEPLDPNSPTETNARLSVRRRMAIALSSLTGGIIALLIGLLVSNLPRLPLGIVMVVAAVLLVVIGGPFLVLYARPPSAMLRSYADRIDAIRKQGKPVKLVSRQGVAVLAIAAFLFALVLSIFVLAPQLARGTTSFSDGLNRSSPNPPSAPAMLSPERIRADATGAVSPLSATFNWPDKLHLRAIGERSLSVGRENKPVESATMKYSFEVESVQDASGRTVLLHGMHSDGINSTPGAENLVQLQKRDMMVFESLTFRVSPEGEFGGLLSADEARAQFERVYKNHSIGGADISKSEIDPGFAKGAATALWMSWVGNLLELSKSQRSGRCGEGVAPPFPTMVNGASRICTVAHSGADCGGKQANNKCIRVEFVTNPDGEAAERELSRQLRLNGSKASIKEYSEETVESILLRASDLVPVNVESWSLQKYQIVLDDGARSRIWKSDQTKISFLDEGNQHE